MTPFKNSTLIENNRMHLDKIYSQDSEECFEGVNKLKSQVIGSNWQKTLVIQTGVVPRLLHLLMEEGSSPELLTEVVVTIGSLARGTDENVLALIEAGTFPILLRAIFHPNERYVEACLRCLRTLCLSSLAPIDLLFEQEHTLPFLIQKAQQGCNVSNQECVANILAAASKDSEKQNFLCNNGAVEFLFTLLHSPVYKVQLPALKCLSNLCYDNDKVAAIVATVSYNGKVLPDFLVELMARDKSTEMQLAAAKCMTYLFRTNTLSAKDPRIVYKALPTLVRMCKRPQNLEEDKSEEGSASGLVMTLPAQREKLLEMIEGAETLAYLTETDTGLQQIASINDHLIHTLADFLRIHVAVSSASAPGVGIPLAPHDQRTKQEANEFKDKLKEAAFKAFASLGANDEEIRKKIIETESLMEHIVSVLCDPSRGVRLAAVRCLHSLSRSVQQLRTTFQDHAVWRPLMDLCHDAPSDILSVASSTLCNLLLEFSPSKEPILERGAIELLCRLTRKEELALRLNGVWALMNMAFQADQKVKSQILASLGTDHIFRLLSDPDLHVLMKTLGLLRNLLSTKMHIDHIMSIHGSQILQAVILILEGDHSPEVKEQALCILANIADGTSAKSFIMANDDVLRNLSTYMMHSNVKLQIAATFCISNLIWKDEEGASERQAKLREMGIPHLLERMVNTPDLTLFDKVKSALQQFS